MAIGRQKLCELFGPWVWCITSEPTWSLDDANPTAGNSQFQRRREVARLLEKPASLQISTEHQLHSITPLCHLPIMFGCHGIGHRWCILGLVFYPWNTKDIIVTHRVEASLSLPGSFAVKGLGHQFGQVLRGASGHFLVVHWCLCEAIQLEGGATGLPKELLLGTKTWWLGDALQSQIGSKCIGTLSQGRVTETGVTWCNMV